MKKQSKGSNFTYLTLYFFRNGNVLLSVLHIKCSFTLCPLCSYKNPCLTGGKVKPSLPLCSLALLLTHKPPHIHADKPTFHNNLCHRLDHAKCRHSDACVIVGLPYVSQFQDVAADGHVILGRQVFCSQHPLDVRHRGAHSYTGDVDVPPWHDLAVRWGDGEAWGDTTH